MSGLLQRDKAGDVVTELYWSEHSEELTVRRTQDAEPVLERAKALRNSGWDGYNGDRTFQATHELPVSILEQWLAEGVNVMDPAHEAEVRKRLNDPALSGFRLTDVNAGQSANGGRIIVKGSR